MIELIIHIESPNAKHKNTHPLKCISVRAATVLHKMHSNWIELHKILFNVSTLAFSEFTYYSYSRRSVDGNDDERSLKCILLFPENCKFTNRQIVRLFIVRYFAKRYVNMTREQTQFTIRILANFTSTAPLSFHVISKQNDRIVFDFCSVNFPH